MLRALMVTFVALAATGCGTTLPEGKPRDAAMLVSSGGPVTSPNGGPVTCRDWNCTCQCPKGCFQ